MDRRGVLWVLIKETINLYKISACLILLQTPVRLVLIIWEMMVEQKWSNDF